MKSRHNFAEKAHSLDWSTYASRHKTGAASNRLMPSTRSQHKTEKDNPPKVVSTTKRGKKLQKVHLTEAESTQVLLDAEKHPGCQFKFLLQEYPSVYRVSDPKQSAYRNRFNYLKDLKAKSPVKYWKQFSEARKIVDEASKEAKAAPQEPANKEAEEEEEEEEPFELTDQGDIVASNISVISEVTSVG